MRRKIVRAADLKPPRKISDEDFDAICRTSAVAMKHHAMLRDFLDEVAAVFGEAIAAEIKAPNREADRLALNRVIEDIRTAKQRLKRTAGPAGRVGLRVAGRRIAPIVAASWMRNRFPGDRAAPESYYWPPDDRAIRRSSRSPLWPTDVDELSLGARIGFMERRAGDAIPALLGDIADALEAGRRAIVQLPVGRKPLEHRKYLLAALAELWHRLGRRPTSGRNSKFGAFSEAVIEAIGWPTEGVNSALPEAKALWLKLYR
jgi:hypothetical protein